MDGQILEKQVKEFRRMLKEDPAKAYDRFGVTLLYSLDDETYFEEVKRFGWEPRTALDFYNQGVLATDKEDHEEAAKLYGKAVELDDTLAPAYYNLGCTYGELGRKDEQKEALSKYLDLISRKERRELPESELADIDAAKEALAEL